MVAVEELRKFIYSHKFDNLFSVSHIHTHSVTSTTILSPLSLYLSAIKIAYSHKVMEREIRHPLQLAEQVATRAAVAASAAATATVIYVD